MKKTRNSLLASNLNKIKEHVLKGVNSFYFRATLFLLGLGVFLPLPMCIGLPSSKKLSKNTINKRLQRTRQTGGFCAKISNKSVSENQLADALSPPLIEALGKV